MKYLVIDLQKNCLDDNKSISNLLRQALIVSKKLNLKELEHWINMELYGYRNEDSEEIPSYRKVFGDCKAFNPVRGWIPVIIDNKECCDMFKSSYVAEPLSDLQFFIDNTDGNEVCLSYNITAENFLRKTCQANYEYKLFIGKSQLQSIINHVRNTILKWSLELESDGILGEEMIFSQTEKEIAITKNYNIYNFYGDIKDSQIQQNSNSSSQSKK